MSASKISAHACCAADAYCIEHRVPVAVYQPRFGSSARVLCAVCLEQDRKVRAMADEKARRAEVAASLRIASGVPDLFLSANIHDFKAVPEKVANWLKAALRLEAQGPLLLIGPTGRGKTHLAAALLREWHRRCFAALYTSPVYYLGEIRKTIPFSSEVKRHTVVTRFTDAPALVIDDIESGEQDARPLMNELLSRRYDRGTLRTTVLISNLNAADLARVLDSRVVDRIRQGSVIHVIDGPNWRIPNA